MEFISEHDGFALYINRQVQSHNVFDYMLDRAGVADRMILSSFAITEAYIRRIIRNRHRIRSIELILDFTIASRNPRITLFAHHNVDALYLVNNHSKIIYTEGGGGCMAAIMSNNATNNHRFESGIIITDSRRASVIGEAFKQVKQECVLYGRE